MIARDPGAGMFASRTFSAETTVCSQSGTASGDFGRFTR
jgi:hypothetical protein